MDRLRIFIAKVKLLPFIFNRIEVRKEFDRTGKVKYKAELVVFDTERDEDSIMELIHRHGW